MDIQYLFKDYELKINYINNHFTRMWNRFNYFLVLETAAFLVGAKINSDQITVNLTLSVV